MSFNFSWVCFIPTFEFWIVSQQDILNFFESFFRILFKFQQIRNINKLFERILFNFFLDIFKFLLSSTHRRRCISIFFFFFDNWCLGCFCFSISFGFFFLFILGKFSCNLSLLLGNYLCIFERNFSFDHSIIFKWSNIWGSIFKSKHSRAMFEIFFPVTFIFATIRVVECSFSVSLS